MVKLSKLFQTLLLCFVAYACPVAIAYAAPNLQFDQTNVTVVQNATFQEKVNINVDANLVQSSDAIVSYAGADLEVTSVTSGGFFPEFSYANDASGTLEVHGYSTTGTTITGNGTLAVIVFKAKKGAGSSTMSFSCTGTSTSTNILTTAGQNILACTQLNQAGISYSGSTAATPTPTPNPSGQNTVPICASLVSDISSAVGTPLAVTFTCSGVDPGGYLNAAEFIFGDGTRQVIEKNVGSPGSLVTTHTYTTIGALGASCRVRDNDQVYSPVSDNCKKIVTIKQAPKIITVSTRTTPYSTPTPLVISIISDTPEPTLNPTAYPTTVLPVAPEPPADNSQLWWIGGGVVAIILAFLLLRRHPKNVTPEAHA